MTRIPNDGRQNDTFVNNRLTMMLFYLFFRIYVLYFYHIYSYFILYINVVYSMYCSMQTIA